MKYRLIDHTADLGIHVFGSDPEALFANAACAMVEQITDLGTLNGSNKSEIRVAGNDWADLMVNWLREVLYLWSGRQMLVKSVDIVTISEYALTATAKVDLYDPGRHVIKHEIKAVTYHQIQVYEGPNGWEAKIIFDI
jgi:protein archease